MHKPNRPSRSLIWYFSPPPTFDTKIFSSRGQNWVLSLSAKLSSKMSHVWNYLGICPYFETQFLENRVSMKNSIYQKLSFLKKFAWNSSSLLFFFFLKVWLLVTQFSANQVFHWNSIFRNSSLKHRCKDQIWRESKTGMDPGPHSPNNEFIECRKES